MLQDTNATLGKLAKLINSVIKSFENSRTSESFSSMLTSIQTFAKVHNISIDIPSQAKGVLFVLCCFNDSKVVLNKTYIVCFTISELYYLVLKTDIRHKILI